MTKLKKTICFVMILLLCTMAFDKVLAKEQVLVGFIQLGEYYGGNEGVDWLIPLLRYENGEYQSCAQELQRIFDEKTKSLQSAYPEKEADKFLRPFQEGKFYLYHKGAIVGEFKTTGPMDRQLPDGIGFPGRTLWKVPKPERGQEGSFSSAIGINRSIDQPFWSKSTLTETQSQKLKKLINIAFAAFFKKLQLDSVEFIKKKSDIVDVMDLDQDGRPEVYVSAGRENPKNYHETEICFLVTWRNNNWIGLLNGFYSLLSTEFSTIGAGSFTLYPVDIDGDGIAELILDRRTGYETWEYFLYRLEKGRPVKVLSLGGGGL